jgi:hypothetical protein
MVQLLKVSDLIQKITIALVYLVFRPLRIPAEGFHDDMLPFVASKPNVAEASPIQKAFENESVRQNLSRDHGKVHSIDKLAHALLRNPLHKRNHFENRQP